MRRTGAEQRLLSALITASLGIPLFTVAAQKPTGPMKSAATTSQPTSGRLPKLWHSTSTQKDYRVEVTNDLFRAEWVNIPPVAAKQGAYIRTECRRAGSKYVGVSRLNMLVDIPGAPAGKNTKLCSFTVRFEVDSISAEKIAGHGESVHDFDVNTCRVLQAGWAEFTWVPKK